MITRDEIIAVADETGLTPAVVEKDYVLGWLLAAIYANDILASSWIFKGGTCLKKCYFETYRFSEDLDFTLRDESQLDEEFLIEQFARVAEWIYEACGIEIPAERLVFDIYENNRGNKCCEGRVYYRSYFVSGKRSIPKVKLDLTADEILVLPSARQTVFHAYSDAPDEGLLIDCYDYPEVFGEKVRALGERGRPRDLYDVINLYRNGQLPAPEVIQDVLRQKCSYKGIGLPAMSDMAVFKDAIEGNWEPMLSHQLPSLPPLEIYWDALPEFFDWLYAETRPSARALSSVAGEGEIYRPVYGQLGFRARSGGSLELIRFAAGNRLCVELDYTDNSGRRSTRVIEPYSLRRARNGNILLYAVRADDGEIRAYKIDQINSAAITNRAFVPRFQVELTPIGALNPVAQTAGSSSSLGLPSPRTAAPEKKRATISRSVRNTAEPIHIYRCLHCNRTFRRKSLNPRLKPHKTKDGWECPGRTGSYEQTVY